MSSGESRGVPVTAWSAVNGLGTNRRDVVAGLRRGRHALSEPPAATPFETLCGTVDAGIPALPDALALYDSRNNRFVGQCLAEMRTSLDSATERWGAGRVGICVGSSTASMDEIERAFSVHGDSGDLPSGFDLFARGSSEGLVHVLRALTGFEGPATVVSNACASSSKAFASAARWIEAGIVDAVLVGGADSLCHLSRRI